jgi:hypothetical protein
MGFNKPEMTVFGILQKVPRQIVSGERGRKENGDWTNLGPSPLSY